MLAFHFKQKIVKVGGKWAHIWSEWFVELWKSPFDMLLLSVAYFQHFVSATLSTGGCCIIYSELCALSPKFPSDFLHNKPAEYSLFSCNLGYLANKKWCLIAPPHLLPFILLKIDKDLNDCSPTDRSNVNHRLAACLLWWWRHQMQTSIKFVWKQDMNYALNKSFYFYAEAK